MERNRPLTLNDYYQQYDGFRELGVITNEDTIDYRAIRDKVPDAVDGFALSVQAVINAKAMKDAVNKELSIDIGKDRVVKLDDAAGDFNLSSKARRFDLFAMQMMDKKVAVHVAFHEVMHWKHHTKKKVKAAIAEDGSEPKNEEAATEMAAALYSQKVAGEVAYGDFVSDVLGDAEGSATEIGRAYESGDAESVNELVGETSDGIAGTIGPTGDQDESQQGARAA